MSFFSKKLMYNSLIKKIYYVERSDQLKKEQKKEESDKFCVRKASSKVVPVDETEGLKRAVSSKSGISASSDGSKRDDLIISKGICKFIA